MQRCVYFCNDWGNSMKKCPFCKTEIEDNARFCLFCMSSLETKQELASNQKHKNIWPFVLIAAILAVLLAVGIGFALKGNGGNAASDFSYTGDATYKDTANSDYNFNVDSSQTLQSTNTPSSDNSYTGSQNGSESNTVPPLNSGGASSSDKNENSSNNSTVSTPSQNTSPQTPSVPSVDTNQNDNNNPNSSDTTQETPTVPDSTDGPTAGSAVYAYRAATVNDALCAGRYTLPKDAIVITGITHPSDNGVYDIPETIDGKPVVAIMDNAFGGENIKDTVKTVIIPACIKEIRGTAFYYCYNMTELYIKGSYIFFPGSGLFAPTARRTGTLTVYATAKCEDKTSLSKVKSLAYYNDAVFVEWNG